MARRSRRHRPRLHPCLPVLSCSVCGRRSPDTTESAALSFTDALLVSEIAVGRSDALAGGPPRRSQRAELPRAGLAAQVVAQKRSLGPGVDYADGREPPGLQTAQCAAVEAIGAGCGRRSALNQCRMTCSRNARTAWRFARHGVVVAMALAHHACEPPSLLGYGLVPASLQLGFHLLELDPHPFCDRECAFSWNRPFLVLPQM